MQIEIYKSAKINPFIYVNHVLWQMNSNNFSQGTHLSSTSSDDDLTTVDETSEPSSSVCEDLPPRVPNRKSYLVSTHSIKEDSNCSSDDSLHTGGDPLYAVIKE